MEGLALVLGPSYYQKCLESTKQGMVVRGRLPVEKQLRLPFLPAWS